MRPFAFGPKAPQDLRLPQDCLSGGPARQPNGRDEILGRAPRLLGSPNGGFDEGARRAPLTPFVGASTMSMAARTAASIAKCGGAGKCRSHTMSLADEVSGSVSHEPFAVIALPGLDPGIDRATQ